MPRRRHEQQAAGAQHAPGLGQQRRGVEHVLEHLAAPDQVEARVLGGQRVLDALEAQVGMARAGPPHRLGGDVDAQDVGRARLRRRGGEVALPATEVEDALAATHVLEQERPPPLHVEPGQRVGSVLPERVVPRHGVRPP